MLGEYKKSEETKGMLAENSCRKAACCQTKRFKTGNGSFLSDAVTLSQTAELLEASIDGLLRDGTQSAESEVRNAENSRQH